jgi:DNA uptake protein ComE-like DNA-binding protein
MLVRNTLAFDTNKASSQLLGVSNDLAKAIAAYREKADAQR